MIKDEGWLELAEVLPTNTRATSNQLSFSDVDTALHIFRSRDDIHEDNSPLTSVILQASLPGGKSYSNGTDSGNLESFPSGDILLRLHPVLFAFLNYASRRNTMARKIHKSRTNTMIREDLPCESTNESISNDIEFHVKLGPLPMLEFQAFQEMARLTKLHSFWKCRPVQIEKLKVASELFLSCVYVEDGNDWLSDRMSDETKNENNKNTITVDQVIGTSLEGRIVRAGTVLLLSTMYGYVIANVTKIIDNDSNQQSDATYRLSDDVLGDYHCHIKAPRMDLNETQRDRQRVSREVSKWESDIPGYEMLLEEMIEIFRLHGDAAAASGVVLTGCIGVGKSRFASCVAHRSENGNFNNFHPHQPLLVTSEPVMNTSSLDEKIYCSSVQDLIFQASIDTNLFENILKPNLQRCKLWIIDDLNLLEIERAKGDEIRKNAEFVMVENALVEAIDKFHLKCCILGIAQSDTNLPPELTKSGRLEKTVHMLPPTQLQRAKIWKYIFARDGFYSSPINDDWIDTLASSTAGCCPKDLLQIYRDAQNKVKVRESQSSRSASVLEWGDLREAIKSFTPSQLLELDVIKPPILDKGSSWKEIHLRSWQNFGGYALLKSTVYRQVVVPWRFFLESLDKSQSDKRVRNEKTWLEPPPGVLFHGISGIGKTVAAKCLAASLGLPTIQVRATDVLDKWLGGSESLLRALFMRARTVSPCILFLDEIDAIACNRDEDESSDVSSRILSTLLNEMDGVSSTVGKSRVLVIACTNRIQSIDSALLRPGRLQEHFHIENPGISDLEEILELRMDRIPVHKNLTISELASKLFDVEATGADVEGICRDATFLAMRRDVLLEGSDVTVSREDFESVITDRFVS